MAGGSISDPCIIHDDDPYFPNPYINVDDYSTPDEKYAEQLQIQEALAFSSASRASTSSSPKTPIIILDSEDSHAFESSQVPDRFCDICMDTKSESEMFRNTKVCGHMFCFDCIRGHVAAKIQENITKVRCPDPNCKGVIGPEVCRLIVPKEVLERWEIALCESLVLGSEKFYCPFKDCSAMLVDDGGGAVTSSECPHCHRLFCAQCKVTWHSGMSCSEYQSLKKDERGLIENDNSLSHCLFEASLFQFPNALRRLFATILIYCGPGDVRKLWNDHYESLSEDYSRHYESIERVQNMVLTDISLFLRSMGKSLSDFDLPNITANVNLESVGFREVHEEYSIVVEDEHRNARDSLNHDQKAAYDNIMMHVDNDCPGVFFVDGPGGTGKTFLYKALLAEVRSRGLIALATASSGVAANNLPGGRTAHSRFKIPINLNNNSVCNITKQSGLAQLLRLAKLIIWDEATMAKRQAIEAVDRTMQDITGVSLPFGGKIMVLGGDFRQVLPVVKRGTRAQIVDSSLRMSPLWTRIKKMRLTINMRAQVDPWFSDFLLRVGNGVEEAIDGSYIRIPDDMAIPYTNDGNSRDVLINAIFPSLETNTHSSEYITSRAILSTKNENVDEINDQLIGRFHGEEKVYYSFDEAEDDNNNFYPLEFLNSLNVSGLPPHYLRLKIGCPIILLRNIDPSNGLCNGTRLICKGFQPNVIDAEIAVGQHAGKRVFLARIPLCPSEEDMFPFRLKRKQFPVRLSFAMTINKAQGQTIPNVGVYLPDSVFSHGQLYVALSRGISRETTKVLVRATKQFRQDGVYTSNVVYKEVLNDK